MRTLDFWKPFIASIIVTPLAVLIAFMSAGFGHGDYWGAKLIFPYTMLAALFLAPDASYLVKAFLLIILPITQFPIYGLVLTFASEKDWLRRLAVHLAVAHIILAALNLLMGSERF